MTETGPEQRRGTRIMFRVKARIDYHGTIIEGEVLNLSLKGMLISTDARIPEDTEITVTIYLSGTTSQVTLSMEGTVVRSYETGIAVTFKAIDVDSFIHLRSVVGYNEGNEEKIMNEFYNIIQHKK